MRRGSTSAAVRQVLRKDLGFGPSCSVVAARLISVMGPRFFDCSHADLGQYARRGLGLLAGLDAKGPREFWTKRVRAREADALFERLRPKIPVAGRRLDDDLVVHRFNAYNLMRLAGQTLEDMLCETRKIM